MNKMFCYQCEQTAGCKGCTGAAGVCGKSSDIALLQDQLTGALIGLARATIGNEDLITPETDMAVIKALFATVTNVNFDRESLEALLAQVKSAKGTIVPDCAACLSPCGRTNDYDMQTLWDADEDIRSLKSLILFGIRGMAAYAYHAAVLGYTDNTVNRFFYRALNAIGMDHWCMEDLLPVVMQVGEVNLKCMALLDQANTAAEAVSAP